MTLNTLLEIAEELTWMGRELIDKMSIVACAPEADEDIIVDDESIWVPMDGDDSSMYVPQGFKNYIIIPRKTTLIRLMEEGEQEMENGYQSM